MFSAEAFEWVFLGDGREGEVEGGGLKVEWRVLGVALCRRLECRRGVFVRFVFL